MKKIIFTFLLMINAVNIQAADNDDYDWLSLKIVVQSKRQPQEATMPSLPICPTFSEENNDSLEKVFPKRKEKISKDDPWHPNNLAKLERIAEYVEPILLPICIDGLTNATITLKSTHKNTFVSFEERLCNWDLEPVDNPTKAIYRPDLKGLENMLDMAISQNIPTGVITNSPGVRVTDETHWQADVVLYIPNLPIAEDFKLILDITCDELWGSARSYSFKEILCLRDCGGVKICAPRKTKETIGTC